VRGAGVVCLALGLTALWGSVMSHFAARSRVDDSSPEAERWKQGKRQLANSSPWFLATGVVLTVIGASMFLFG
jgi:hypothetical protein